MSYRFCVVRREKKPIARQDGIKKKTHRPIEDETVRTRRPPCTIARTIHDVLAKEEKGENERPKHTNHRNPRPPCVFEQSRDYKFTSNQSCTIHAYIILLHHCTICFFVTETGRRSMAGRVRSWTRSGRGLHRSGRLPRDIRHNIQHGSYWDT